MDFFNSLTLDLKMLVVGIAGVAILALFSGNAKAEKRYILVLALLSAAGVYRFMHTTGKEDAEIAAARNAGPRMVVPDKHVPLVSTSAKQ